jgi:DNA polymerase-3 subunit beta
MNKSDLHQALTALSRIAPGRPSKPILSSILIVPGDDSLTLTAFDESTGYTTTVEGSHNLTCPVCIPAKLAESIIGRLPDGELSLNHEDDTLTIESLSGTYELRTMPGDDFPSLPMPDESDNITIGADSLLAAIKETLFACSSDESKQVLTGAHFTLNGDSLESAATDGHRLAVHKAEIDSTSTNADVTIPAVALREIAKLIEKCHETDVSVELNRTLARFTIGSDVFVTRLLEGQYPNYAQLIPKSFERVMQCDRKDLIDALERTAILADQKNNIVQLTFADKLEVSVDAVEVGSGVERLDYDGNSKGFGFKTAFNVRYLIDGLKQIRSNTVAIHANTATSPVVLKDSPESGFLYLVMPVSIRSNHHA